MIDARDGGTQGRRWYAVATESGREAVAREDLAQEDFEVLLPRLAERDQFRIGAPVVRRPLYPGYVFVCCDLGAPRPAMASLRYRYRGSAEIVRLPAAKSSAPRSAFDAIEEARCVIGIVKIGESPVPARSGVVEKLSRLCALGDGAVWLDDHGMLCPGEPIVQKSIFCKGMRVRVTKALIEPSMADLLGTMALEGLYLGPKGSDIRLLLDTPIGSAVVTVPAASARPV